MGEAAAAGSPGLGSGSFARRAHGKARVRSRAVCPRGEPEAPGRHLPYLPETCSLVVGGVAKECAWGPGERGGESWGAFQCGVIPAGDRPEPRQLVPKSVSPLPT